MRRRHAIAPHSGGGVFAAARSASDAVSVADTATRSALGLARSASDSASVSDAATDTQPPAFVQKVGEAFTDITNVASLTFAPSAPTRTGNGLLAFIKFGGGSFISSVTDTKGNTWTAEGQAGTTGPTISVFRCLNHTGLTTGDTITFNTPGGQGNWGGVVVEVSGVNARDEWASNLGSSTSTLTVNQSTTTTVANEIAFAAFGEGGSPPASSTYTPSTGWTQVPTTNAAATLGLAYRILTATGTQSVTWTASNALNCAGLLQTYD